MKPYDVVVSEWEPYVIEFDFVLPENDDSNELVLLALMGVHVDSPYIKYPGHTVCVIEEHGRYLVTSKHKPNMPPVGMQALEAAARIIRELTVNSEEPTIGK